jgi:hypothetical protein
MDFSSSTVAEGMEGGKQGFWVSPFCLILEGIASSGPVDHVFWYQWWICHSCCEYHNLVHMMCR